jgi:hypothetical protein
VLIISHYGGTARWQSMKTQSLFGRDIMPRMLEAASSGRVGAVV